MARKTHESLLGVSAVLVLAATVALARTLWPAPVDERGCYPTECKVHGMPSVEDVVPLHYGTLLLQADEELDGDRPEYTDAKTYAQGGCVVRDANRAQIRDCPECRTRRAAFETNGS